MLTREQFDKLDRGEETDIRREEVLGLPDSWGGSAWVRTMEGGDLGRYNELAYPLNDAGTEARFERVRNNALLVCFAVCDADGKRLFSESDIESIQRRAGWVLSKLADRIRKLNPSLLAKGEEDAAKN